MRNRKTLTLTVVCALACATPSIALAQQSVAPGWSKTGSVICPDGYDYSDTERLCWEAEELKRRKSNQETAAIVFLLITGLGTIAGIYLGLRKIEREERAV